MDTVVKSLAENLRREHDYTKREKYLIQDLYSELLKVLDELFREWWILQAQKEIATKYLKCIRENGCQLSQRFFELDRVQFVKAFNVVNYEEFKYVELLKSLHSKPELIVQLLLHAQELGQTLLQNLCFIIYTGIYGSCICSNDDDIFVEILQHLIRSQVGPSNKPRKILKSGNIAFTVMLRIYIENTSSAKRFLTAALHKPVVQLIMQDDWYLDISPSQVLERLPPDFQTEKFGPFGTKEFDQKVSNFREELVTTLTNLTQNFINSIGDNLYLFPTTYLKLLNYLAEEVTRAGYLSSEEIQMLCKEFVFECFLYPAIVDPETYGVTSDFVISSIARHNLMEVGKILQTLVYQTEFTTSSRDDHNPHHIQSPQDLYSKFRTNSMTSVMRSLLASAQNLFGVKMETTVHSESGDDYSRFSIFDNVWRSVALLTPSGLDILIHSLRSLFRTRSESVLQYQSVFEILLQLPDRVAGTRDKPCVIPPHVTKQDTLNQLATSSATASPVVKKKSNPLVTSSSADLFSSSSPQDESALSQSLTSISDTTRDMTHLLTGSIEDVLIFSLELNNDCPGMMSENKVLESECLSQNCVLNLSSHTARQMKSEPSLPHRRRKESHCSTASGGSSSSHSNSDLSVGCSSSVSAGPSSSNAGIGAPSAAGGSGGGGGGGPSQYLSVNNLSQSRVISASASLMGQPGNSTAGARGGQGGARFAVVDKGVSASETVEKRTRFSLSNDQEAFSVAGDNLEAVSEVAASEIASTHSAPSVDLESQEDEGDGFSDMISANVSGRGTPSIISGGRDSPLSGTDLPVNMPKNDVTDKFGKFDIPPSRPGEIEARSTVSDTWSTDVLASDSETTETTENQQRLVEIMEEQPGSFQSQGAARGYNSSSATTPIRKSSSGSRSVRNQENSSRGNAAANPSSSQPMIGEGWTVEEDRQKAFERLNDFENDDLEYPEQTPRSSGYKSTHDKFRNRNRRHFHLSSILHLRSSAGAKSNPGDDQDELDLADDRLSVDDDLIDGEHVQDIASNLQQPLPVVCEQSGHILSGSRLYPSNSSDQLQQHHSNTVICTANFENSAFIPTESNRKNVHKTKSNSRLTASNREDSPVKFLPRSSSHNVAPPHSTKNHRFSKTADQSDKMKARGSSFFEAGFSKLKEKISKSNHHKNRDHSSAGSNQSKTDSRLSSSSSRHMSEGQAGDNVDVLGEVKESVPEMLARYKQKAQLKSSLPPEDSSRKLSDQSNSCQDVLDAHTEPLFFDPENITQCPAWQDAKRKLRLVLSNVTSLPLKSENLFIMEVGSSPTENYLIRTLNAFLADAINQQEGHLCTQIQETMRVVRMFNSESIMKLLKSMEKDWKERQMYLSYLMSTREQLGLSKQRAQELVKRCSRNRSIATLHMMSMCIQDLIQSENSYFTQFASQFQILSENPTGSTEEKQQLVMNLLRQITTLMQNMPFYKTASPEKATEAEQFIERMVMSQIYRSTMCLNDLSAENARDSIFHREISLLASSVTAHDLHIPRKYYCVTPFESAQNELLLINSYKTPQDKVECVKRVNSNIINMLRMANSTLIPCADDILPVFIFVIIQANPPRLLSNVNYVDTFYESRLDGESQYIWCQFKVSIEEIRRLVSDVAIKSSRQFDNRSTFCM